MENLLKKDFLQVINCVRRSGSPEWTMEPQVHVEEVSEHTFDMDDPKDNSQTVIRPLGEGTASYVNGTPEHPYTLRIICYDEYLHQFIFDDGKGHTDASLLKDNSKMADLIVYDKEESRVWIVVHELSKGSVQNKRNRARLQLSATLNLLCKSEHVRAFIEEFRNKWCITSAKDERILTPNGVADAFMEAYSVTPEPLEFNYGVIHRFGFKAFETSKVVLV